MVVLWEDACHYRVDEIEQHSTLAPRLPSVMSEEGKKEGRKQARSLYASCHRLLFTHYDATISLYHQVSAVSFRTVWECVCVCVLVVRTLLFLLTGMNILLAWECSELRLGKGRAEKEKTNDSRGEAPIYNPDGANTGLPRLYASLTPQIMFLCRTPTLSGPPQLIWYTQQWMNRI